MREYLRQSAIHFVWQWLAAQGHGELLADGVRRRYRIPRRGGTSQAAARRAGASEAGLR